MDQSIFFYYFLVLLAYVPGIIGIFRFKFYGKFPLILFCFVGMFVFHAAGSILILQRGCTSTGVALFSSEYIIMLIAEAVLFYLITWPYLFLRKNTEYTMEVNSKDYIVIPVLLSLIGIIIFMYRRNIGTFLLTDLLSGGFNVFNVSSFRMEKSFGSSYFSYFAVGFITLPSLLAAHMMLIFLNQRRFRVLSVMVILICFVPDILLGQKAGILRTATILFITYTIHLGVRNQPPVKAFSLRSLMLIFIAFIPTFIIYNLYMNFSGYKSVLKSFIYRLFGSYSETLAAAVPMVESFGLAYGNTFPMFGSYPGLDVRMHYFLYGFEGAATVPAVGEGYINFGWPGFILFAGLFFIILIILQELLSHLKYGVFSYAVAAWFAYLAIYTNFIGLFATFLSPLNYVVFLFVIAIGVIDYTFGKLATRRVAGNRDILLKVKRIWKNDGSFLE